MKTGGICDIEYFMKHGCRGCRLSRLCQEMSEKNELSLPKKDEQPSNEGPKKIKIQKQKNNV